LNVVSLAVAFGAGVISITSPCCLPLLPGYLGYLSGMSADQQAENRWRTVGAALLFVAGFSVIFVALGATASELGALLLSYRFQLNRLAGLFILAMGLVLLLEGRVGWLSRGGEWSRRWGRGQLWAALPLGAAFAITWTPCIGPVLGAVLTLAGTTADLSQGVALLAAYSLGLGLPFVALSLSLTRVRSWLRRGARGMALMQSAAGVLLVAMGVLLLTDRWLPLVAPVLAWYAKAHWPPV
jgi:cytochrome c-type biogenesis protein